MNTRRTYAVLSLLFAIGLSLSLHAATVGRIAGSFSNNSSGAALYTIPIECPVGVNGMQPSLALVYNSQSGAGLAGWGWGISGLSSIMRTPQTKYYDNIEQEISWTSADSLILDGQRLMAIRRSTDSIEYRLEADPTIMVCGYGLQSWGPTYFKAFTKSGSIMTYGDPQGASTAYAFVYDVASSATGATKQGWNLTEVVDRNGNFMKIEYGTSYSTYKGNLINKITYGGNKKKGSAGDLVISFEYAKRPDDIQGFVSGKEFLQQLRLTKIVTAVGGVTQKNYRLVYQSGAISRLSSITLYDKENPQYDPLSFSYGEPDSGESNTDITFIKEDTFVGIGDLFKKKESPKMALMAVDLDGDGYNELGDAYNVPELMLDVYGMSTGYFDIRRKEQDWVATHRFPIAFAMGDAYKIIQSTAPELFADFNGNGSYESVFFYFEGQSLNVRITDRSNEQVLCDELLHSTSKTPFVMTGTYLGNPLANALVIYDAPQIVSGGYKYRYDLIASSINGNVFALNDDMFLTVPSKILSATTARLGTANYRDDLFLLLENGTTWIVKNKQTQTSCFSESQLINTGLNMGRNLLDRPFGASIDRYQNDIYAFGDVNNDGLLDVVYRKGTNAWYIGYNKGNGKFSSKQITTITAAISPIYGDKDQICLQDLNNDGFLDIVIGDENAGSTTKWRFYLNNGNSSFSLWRTVESPEKAAYSCFADLHRKGTVNWTHATTDGKVVITDFGFGRHKNLLTNVTTTASPALSLKYKPQAECKFRDGMPDNMNNCNTFRDYLNIGYIPFKTTMLPVVSETSDGRTRVCYDYGTSLVNWFHRGYVGFRYMEERDSVNVRRIETLNKIYHSNKLYNAMVPVVNNLYSTFSTGYTPATVDGTGYSLLPLGGKRFALQLSGRHYQDNINFTSSTEDYTNDEFNNITSCLKKSGQQEVSTRYVYGKYGAWCNNVPTSETRTEKFGSDTQTRGQRYTYKPNGNMSYHYTNTSNLANGLRFRNDDFDDFGNPKTIVRTAEAKSRYSYITYSESGRFIIKEIDELGQEITREWDEARGLLLKETTRMGTTSYAYDVYGNLQTTTFPNGKKKTDNITWASSVTGQYTAGCKYMITSTPEGSSPVTIWYNAYGQEIASRTETAFNSKKIYVFKEYDANTGRLSRVSKPTYNLAPADWAETYEYDVHGRVTKFSTPKGVVETEYDFGWDEQDNRCSVKRVITPDSFTETYYDENNLVSQSSVNGKTVFFTHTLGGKVKTATPEGGIAVTFKYDQNGNRTQINDPNTSIINSEYDNWGQLVKETQNVHAEGSSRTVTTSYTYLTNGLLSQKTGGTVVTNYVYDTYKRLQRMYTSESEKTFTYDTYDRATQVSTSINGKTLTSQKQYDIYGRMTRETYPSGYYILNNYDAYGYLTSVTDGSSRQIWELLTCDAEGKVLSEKKGNVVTKYRYSLEGRLDSVAAPGIVDMRYTYHPTGNIKSYKDAIVNQMETYTYDDLDRFVSFQNSRSFPNTIISYDTKNRIFVKYASERSYFSYNDPARPYAITDSQENTAVDQNLSYTDFKKIKTIHQYPYGYTFYYGPDEERLLMKRSFMSGTPVERYYAHNYEEENYSTQSKKYHYIYGGNGIAAIYFESPADLRSVYTDIRGSLVALARGSSVLERYAYDPWGGRINPQNWNPPSVNSILPSYSYRGYTMHEHLDEIGLINMNARLYDPKTSQFLSPDPQLQAPGNWLNYNRYAYCLNNPLKYTDPSGEIIFSILAGIYCPALLPAAIQLDIAWMYAGFSSVMNGENFIIGAAKGLLPGLMNAGLSFLNIPGMIPNGLLHAAGNVATNAVTNMIYEQDFSKGAGFSAVTGFAGGAYSGYNMSKAKGLNYWWGGEVKYGRTQWSFLTSALPENTVKFNVQFASASGGQTCVVETVMGLEAKRGGTRLEGEVKENTGWTKEGAPIPGTEEAYSQFFKDQGFSNEAITITDLQNIDKMRDVSNSGGDLVIVYRTKRIKHMTETGRIDYYQTGEVKFKGRGSSYNLNKLKKSDSFYFIIK